jgi:hypothetical protein
MQLVDGVAQRIASSEARAEGRRRSLETCMSSSALPESWSGNSATYWRVSNVNGSYGSITTHSAPAKPGLRKGIARGLQEQLAELAADVKSSTRRLTWKSSLQWALGIAVAISLTVGICVSVFLPHVERREKPNVERPS